jgi:hypothetical protein
MGTKLIKSVEQVAGIGSVALGVFLLPFRDLSFKQIFLMPDAWSVGFGI